LALAGGEFSARFSHGRRYSLSATFGQTATQNGHKFSLGVRVELLSSLENVSKSLLRTHGNLLLGDSLPKYTSPTS
jgi:hypothetical protein